MVEAGTYYFWLGASADADPATHASHGAPEGSPPSGEYPLREAYSSYELAMALWRISERVSAHKNYRVTPTDRAMLELAGRRLWQPA